MSNMSEIFKVNVILIGFMASGKSVVAKRLAQRLKMPIADVDVLIENEQGMKIKDIFKIYGEPYFRKLEKEMANKISRIKGVVVSTGGGIVLNAENRRILRKCGIVFYLKASPDVILKRIKSAKNNERPLLKGKMGLKGEIKKLLKMRAPYYNACAHYVIDTSEMTIEEVVKKIISIFRNL